MHDYGPVWDEIAHRAVPRLLDYRSSLSSVKRSTKPDGTWVSSADMDMERLVSDVIQTFEPGASIVSEESVRRTASPSAAGRVWVVDPIDGTSQFLNPDAREFCTAVAVLEDGRPTACLLLAPELGLGGSALTITVTGRGVLPLINGSPATCAASSNDVCITRSSRLPASAVETAAVEAGFRVKTKGTSMSLDITRAVLDIRDQTGLASFRWLVASQVWLWDAVAGMVLASAVGRAPATLEGVELSEIPRSLILAEQPRLPGLMIAQPDDREWITSKQLLSGTSPGVT